jgi:hypothetical protein
VSATYFHGQHTAQPLAALLVLKVPREGEEGDPTHVEQLKESLKKVSNAVNSLGPKALGALTSELVSLLTDLAAARIIEPNCPQSRAKSWANDCINGELDTVFAGLEEAITKRSGDLLQAPQNIPTSDPAEGTVDRMADRPEDSFGIDYIMEIHQLTILNLSEGLRERVDTILSHR